LCKQKGPRPKASAFTFNTLRNDRVLRRTAAAIHGVLVTDPCYLSVLLVWSAVNIILPRETPGRRTRHRRPVLVFIQNKVNPDALPAALWKRDPHANVSTLLLYPASRYAASLPQTICRLFLVLSSLLPVPSPVAAPGNLH
jgi:hypothetical protein